MPPNNIRTTEELAFIVTMYLIKQNLSIYHHVSTINFRFVKINWFFPNVTAPTFLSKVFCRTWDHSWSVWICYEHSRLRWAYIIILPKIKNISTSCYLIFFFTFHDIGVNSILKMSIKVEIKYIYIL